MLILFRRKHSISLAKWVKTSPRSKIHLNKVIPPLDPSRAICTRARNSHSLVFRHRDGIRLRPSRRAAMSLSHDGTVELLLARVTSRDAGVYTCTATNEVGKAETSSRVSVIGPDDGVGAARDDAASPHVVVNPPDVDIP